MTVQKFILQDKVAIPTASGFASSRWIYQPENVRPNGRTDISPHVMIALTPAEFATLDNPGVLYVDISTTPPPPEEKDDDHH